MGTVLIARSPAVGSRAGAPAPAAAGPVPARELRLSLFGPPRLSLDSRPLVFARRKTAALLIYLAVTARPQPRQVLAALLWGELPGQRSSGGLRKALTELREQVGDSLLISRQAVALRPGCPLWLDTAVFEAQLAVGVAERDTALLEAAVDLYQDDFLSGFELLGAPGFEEWALLRGERLRGLLAQGLQALVEGYARRGELAVAMACARRLLALDPWREEVHHILMALLARAGQRSAALAQYAACRRVLAGELGVEPLPETTALYERLRRAAGPPPGNLPAVAPELVGRRAERAVLHARLADPRCRLVTVSGLAGIGKTRLALDAVHAWRATAAVDGQSDYDGIYVVPLADGAGPGEVAAAIADVAGVPLPRGVPPDRALPAALGGRSVLLVLDNLSPTSASAALVSGVLRGVPRVRLLVTARRRLGLDAESTLTLGGLALPATPADLERSEAGQLLLHLIQRAALPMPPADEDRPHLARVCALVGGHPLALTLAARWLRALPCDALADALARDWDLLAGGSPRDAGRHQDVRAVLAASWALASAEARGALRRLSALADGFDVAAAAVVGAGPAELLDLGERGLLEARGPGLHALPALARRFAAEQLAERPDEMALTAARQAAHYAEVGQRLVAAAPVDRAALVRGLPNLLLAWQWATAHRAVALLDRLAEAVALAWEAAGDCTEGAVAFELAIRAVSHQPRRRGSPRPCLVSAARSALAHYSRLRVRLVAQGRAGSSRSTPGCAPSAPRATQPAGPDQIAEGEQTESPTSDLVIQPRTVAASRPNGRARHFVVDVTAPHGFPPLTNRPGETGDNATGGAP